ncbi:MAG: hypothetical protein DRJ50_08170 [Actinobacteria bacterium]|nr:MAG: hypothetical protein DRJ50_08170 [Actinomycetota bacterium]
MEQALAIPELIALGDRVAPVMLAHERTLPVAEEFTDLFVEGGLVRGRILTCTGLAATSLALALVAPVVAAGSWLGIVDLPTIGLDAASEFGLPLERVVAINSDRGDSRGAGNSSGSGDSGFGSEPDDRWAQRWPEVMAAAIDGFDVLLARVPTGVNQSAMRKVATRVQRRGAVVVLLGDLGPAICDGVLHTEPMGWTGVGDGHGHLQQRSVVVQASGRRMPGRCRRELMLPA